MTRYQDSNSGPSNTPDTWPAFTSASNTLVTSWLYTDTLLRFVLDHMLIMICFLFFLRLFFFLFFLRQDVIYQGSQGPL